MRFLFLDILPVSWRYKIQEKKAHCYDSHVSAIRLCPNINMTLCHPLGYCFQLTTDSRGDRIVAMSNHESDSIWAIGDSLTMGFGIDDEGTIAYLLSRDGYNTRNLSSDSLGASHIYRILKSELERLDENTPKPKYLVWVFSRSDFLDDTIPSGFKPVLVFYLGKVSIWANAIRAELESFRLARDANDYKEFIAEEYNEPPKSHPTIHAIQNIKKLSDKNGSTPIVVLAPDWNPVLDQPVLETEYFQYVRSLFLNQGYEVVDMTEEYRKLSQEILWLDHDGHPNTKAHFLFRKEILSKIKKIEMNQKNSQLEK